MDGSGGEDVKTRRFDGKRAEHQIGGFLYLYLVEGRQRRLGGLILIRGNVPPHVDAGD